MRLVIVPLMGLPLVPMTVSWPADTKLFVRGTTATRKRHSGSPERRNGVPQASVLAGYGTREQTRTDHLLAVTDYLGWKSAPAAGWRPGSWRRSWRAGRWSTIPRRCCAGVPQSMSPPRSEDPGVIDA